jgi:hypothetical protein
MCGCCVQGVPQATQAIALQPIAIAKAKRLGRDLSIKVTLQPSAGSNGSNGSSSGSTGSTAGSSVTLVECGEEFLISWPSLLFLDPISPACTLAYKGGCAAIAAAAAAAAASSELVCGAV